MILVPIPLCPVQEIVPCASGSDCSPHLSYQIQFIWFILRSLIHLDLSFIQGCNCRSICILLHNDIYLDQHQLLNMPLPQIVYLLSLSQNSVILGLVDLILGLNPIPLISISVLISISDIIIAL